MSNSPETFLTQDAFDRLAAELEHLSGPGREDIAKRIESAREEGDLKENGGYHAAKDEQGKQEARIRTLQHLLKNAVVREALEETGYRFRPTALVGIYNWRNEDKDVTYLRFAFAGEIEGHEAGRPLACAASPRPERSG